MQIYAKNGKTGTRCCIFLKRMAIFAFMNACSKVTIVTRSTDLPRLSGHKFLHSPAFFRIIESTPGYHPVMAIAYDAGGRILAHLMAITCKRRKLFPPFFFTQGRIYGEGDYEEGTDREEVFGLMLAALTQRLRQQHCVFTEVSDLPNKMFAYMQFRENGYCPIPWQEIHNSLHSKPPMEQLSDKTRRQIEAARAMGVRTKCVENEEEMEKFFQLIHGYYRTRPYKFTPPKTLFSQIAKEGQAKLLITAKGKKVIGATACLFAEGNAYLWYVAARRMDWRLAHPSVLAVWGALEYAHAKGCRHLVFFDAGQPYRKSRLRNLIMRFGGKPVTKFRWYTCPIPWISRLLSWMLND